MSRDEGAPNADREDDRIARMTLRAAAAVLRCSHDAVVEAAMLEQDAATDDEAVRTALRNMVQALEGAPIPSAVTGRVVVALDFDEAKAVVAGLLAFSFGHERSLPLEVRQRCDRLRMSIELQSARVFGMATSSAGQHEEVSDEGEA